MKQSAMEQRQNAMPHETATTDSFVKFEFPSMQGVEKIVAADGRQTVKKNVWTGSTKENADCGLRKNCGLHSCAKDNRNTEKVRCSSETAGLRIVVYSLFTFGLCRRLLPMPSSQSMPKQDNAQN